MRRDFRQQAGERRIAAELDPGRILAFRGEKIARQRQAGVTATPRFPQAFERIGQQFGFAGLRLGGAGDEGGVGAVLDQSPHQIGEQVTMRPDRRIDPTDDSGMRAQRLVQRLAHAVQALEFIIAPPFSARQDGSRGQGVVGGELRKNRIFREQALGAGDVIHVGHRLAAENWIIGEPALLGALDLAVPIGALDQPRRDAAAFSARQFRDVIDHRARALLIGLDREAEALPASQRIIA